MEDFVDFCLLGPLQVADGDRVVRLGEGRQRSVLVLLLLHRNEAVSSERLIDALWGERPPATAAKVLQNHVGQLRRALGDREGERLQTRGRGYLLRVDDGGLDVERFEQLVRVGSEALESDEPAEAAARLSEALALWRGPALADVAYEAFAQSEIARLEERRLVALERRIDADLALGRHAELIAELETLVAAHPVRERQSAQLMLALYRSGRQGEALAAYQHARRALVDELGVEPAAELRELQAAILRQDAALAPAPRVWPHTRSRPRLVRALLGAGGTLLIAAAVAGALLASGGGNRDRALLGADAVGAIDPATGRLVAAVPLPGSPDRLAATRDAVWTLSDDSRTLSAIDVRKRAVSSAIAPGGVPADVAAGEGRLWTVDVRGGRLIEMSPVYGSVVRRFPLPAPPSTGLPTVSAFSPWSIAAGGGAVWLTDGSSRLTRVDPRSRRVSRIELHRPLNGVTFYRGKVWAISGRGSSVLRIDPRRLEPMDRIAIAGRPGFASPYPLDIEGGLGALWVLNGNTGTVTRIDLRQLAPTTTTPIGVDHVPVRLAVGGGAVWVADADGTLARIDPATNAVRTTTVGHGLNDVAVAGGAVWVSGFGGNGARLAGDRSPTAAATTPGIRPLAPDMCSPLYFRPGDRPRLLITSDLPLQGAPGAIQMTDAIQFVLQQRRFQAGPYSVAYQACDDSTQSNSNARKCAANARAYARNLSVVGVIGTMTSDCAIVEVPILNRASRGPLAMISPTNTYLGLTRAGPGAAAGDPARYAPTGRRSYVRIIAPDDVQATADAQLAHQLGVRRAYVLDDGSLYGAGLAAGFAHAAARLGIRVRGPAKWGKDTRQLVHQVRAARPDAVFLGGYLLPDAPRVVTELRRRLPDRVKLLAADGFRVTPWLVRLTGRAAEGMYVSAAGLPLEQLHGPGAHFVAQFGAAIGERPGPFSVYAAQATQIMLDAVAHSDGTRASVLHELFTARVHNGILANFAITPEGDTTARTITTYRVTGGAFRVWRVITPTAKLLSASSGDAGLP